MLSSLHFTSSLTTNVYCSILSSLFLFQVIIRLVFFGFPWVCLFISFFFSWMNTLGMRVSCLRSDVFAEVVSGGWAGALVYILVHTEPRGIEPLGGERGFIVKLVSTQHQHKEQGQFSFIRTCKITKVWNMLECVHLIVRFVTTAARRSHGATQQSGGVIKMVIIKQRPAEERLCFLICFTAETSSGRRHRLCSNLGTTST